MWSRAASECLSQYRGVGLDSCSKVNRGAAFDKSVHDFHARSRKLLKLLAVVGSIVVVTGGGLPRAGFFIPGSTLMAATVA